MYVVGLGNPTSVSSDLCRIHTHYTMKGLGKGLAGCGVV